MNLGYDPKWAQVLALSFLEGIDGQTKIHGEKQAGVIDANNCSISRACPAFPAGALYLQNNSITRYAVVPSGATVFGNFLVEVSFYQTEWSAGEIYEQVILYKVGNWEVSINPVTKTLLFSINKGTTSSADWVSVGYAITDPGAWLNRRHDVRCRFSSTDMSIELDEEIVATFSHGATSIAGPGNDLRVGGSGDPTRNFLGYIGPLRWTGADLRAELTGQPMTRFPVLGAVDPHREKVVFHSHCEPTSTGVIFDTKGAPVQMLGAEIDPLGRFGVGSLRSTTQFGCVKIGPLPALIPGERDFIFETLVRITVRNNFKYFFAMFDGLGTSESNMVLGLGIGGESTMYLRVNGVTSSHGVTSAYNAWRSVKLIRAESLLALYYNNVLITTRNVGGLSIVSDGYAWLGGAGGVGGNGNPSLLIDEPRFTVGTGRFDPNLTTVPDQIEAFSVFGPRSLSGTVIDADGNPLVRTVRAYHRLTGRLISETISATDGTWSLPVADTGEHFVVVHDDVKNALIYDRVQPVLVT